MNDIKELVIQLPTMMRVKGVPQTRLFRWFKALHETLQPLSQYKLKDGGSAMHIAIAADHGMVAYVGRPFEYTEKLFEGYFKNFVCSIVLCDQYGISKILLFGLEDFLGDASGAREKFARVIAHLEEYAVPQVAPEYITNALAALQGKEV